MSGSNFHEASHWNEFYGELSSFGVDKYEWYFPFSTWRAELFDSMQLQLPVADEAGMKQCKILVIGCGNSCTFFLYSRFRTVCFAEFFLELVRISQLLLMTLPTWAGLSADLHEAGFRDIISMDYAESCIQLMCEKYAHLPLVCTRPLEVVALSNNRIIH